MLNLERQSATSAYTSLSCDAETVIFAAGLHNLASKIGNHGGYGPAESSHIRRGYSLRGSTYEQQKIRAVAGRYEECQTAFVSFRLVRS